MKSRKLFKLFVVIIAVLLFVLLFYIGVYAKKYSDLEKGILIDNFVEKDKVVICTSFDIDNNLDVSINSLEYHQGFKDIYVKVYINTNYNQLDDILNNYVDSNLNYQLDSLDFVISENYIQYKQLVNENNLYKHAFVFYYQDEVVIVFYSNKSDPIITNLIDDKMLKQNYELITD